MAQAGIHSMAGLAVRRWAPARQWLVLGIVLGNLLPDADNLAVAAATVAGAPTTGLHRTFTHSLFTVAGIILLFQLAAVLSKRPRWGNLGIGLGIGVLMHILLDLLIWFNGVQLLWPLPYWLNLWEGYTPPDWFSRLMMPVELLCFALYFRMLSELAQRQRTNLARLPALRVWTAVQSLLFLVFLLLLLVMETGYQTIFGAVYLLSLGLATVISVQMRDTVETAVS